MKIDDLPPAEARLIRIALGPARSAADVLWKVQAIGEIVDDGHPAPWEEIRRELEWAVENQFGTERGAKASRMAMGILRFLDGEVEFDFPSEHPNRRADESYWPGRSNPFHDLDCFDAEGMRDGWRRRVMGPPPWPRAT